MADDIAYGISGNPGAVNTIVGTGELGKLVRIPAKTGIRLGGIGWVTTTILPMEVSITIVGQATVWLS